MNEVWYLLYDGQSTDGTGHSKYVGRTKDKVIALLHFKKVKSNVYSTGKVIICTDYKLTEASNISEFN